MLPVNRLLEIAHEAEMAGARRMRQLVRPASSRLRRAARLEQDVELGRGGVLRFVEDDAEFFLADSRSGDRMLKKLFRERNLVVIGHETALQSEFAVVPLNFRSHTRGEIA